ncbi:MAG TPA: phosphate ABC transporter permease subunit PstC [Xanthobacteraceae bacterium]|nr:phosphate ABC transporter permease subunit PstC [Xanthobacteraceae bacterium]
MSIWWLVIVVLAAMGFAYQSGAAKSRKLAAAGGAKLHSLPTHYGALVALWCGIPALVILLLFLAFEGDLIRAMVASGLPDQVRALPSNQLAGILNRVESLASGYGVAGSVELFEAEAAAQMSQLRTVGNLALIAVVAAAFVLGLAHALRRLTPRLRARNEVERVVVIALIACSAVAIVTTVGIVLSMLGEAVRFFQFVHPFDFFFGTVWNPRFSTVGAGASGGYGLLPLLWGTVLITIIAMAVAVPIGLMTAIYLSEYASPRLRSLAKPALEILAGIPTIVYGFFALTVVGPFLASIGAAIGIEIRATSALTAGLVMGIMIIPFVSSLSDDIITQVPRAMRDGSFGLGATHSETIRRVVLPAALPGIVGAFLLAVSRAVGETMIVVMAAGNAPVLQANPLQAISTVTVTIVNQLTGDIDFTSPQSLVAFALGLTLFTITLGLNIVALYIVRRYREQYE